MSDGTIWETHLDDLQARWHRPITPGGLDHLNNVLRDHLTGLAEWIDHMNWQPGDEDPLPLEELAKRLRELADVHTELLDYVEIRAVTAAERAASNGTAAEKDTRST